MSFLWGFGYPHTLRWPLYLFVAAAVLLTQPRALLIPTNLLATIGGATVALVYYAYFADLASSIWLALVAAWVCAVCATFRILMANQDPDRVLMWTRRGILTAVYVALGAVWFDTRFRSLGESVAFFQSTTLPAGFFPEPSHFGFTIGPALGFLLLVRGSRMLGALAILLSLALIPSTTLLVGFLLFVGIYTLRRYPVTLSLALITLPFAVWVYSLMATAWWEYKEASAFAWQYGFARAWVILQANAFGVGPFGWWTADLDPSQGDLVLEDLNARDLASLLPFAAASFGIPGIVLLAYVILRLSFSSSLDYPSRYTAMLALAVLATHLFRWSGFLLSPLPILLALWFAQAARPPRPLSVSPSRAPAPHEP